MPAAYMNDTDTLRQIAGAYEMDIESRPDGLKKVNMHIGEGGFPVLLGYNKLGALFAELKKLDADQVFLGYDENSFEHCAPQIEAELDAQGINFFRCVMGVTESAKVMSTLDTILDTFLKGGGTRQTVVVPVGGGIVANTFGLAAGLLFRGIRLVQVPTTFLSAHDAAASSQKQAINHAGYKNIVGLYHMPTLALVDTAFYKTLGATEIKAGLGELTKNAALFGGVHYELMQKTTMRKGWRLSGEELCEATCTGLGAKDMLLKLDPREKHIALLFEYGHTVGHALELTSGVATSHGEAVSVGMLAASYVATEMGIMSVDDRERHDALVFALEPQVALPPRDITDEVLDKVCHDNKRGYLPERDGFCPFILAKKIGELHAPNAHYLEYVPLATVRKAIVHVVGWLRAANEKEAAAKAGDKRGAPAQPAKATKAVKVSAAKVVKAASSAEEEQDAAEFDSASTSSDSEIKGSARDTELPEYEPAKESFTTDLEQDATSAAQPDHPAVQGGCSSGLESRVEVTPAAAGAAPTVA